MKENLAVKGRVHGHLPQSWVGSRAPSLSYVFAAILEESACQNSGAFHLILNLISPKSWSRNSYCSFNFVSNWTIPIAQGYIS
ncbi:hypothetical protein TNCV_1447191 [Trichonephila clavipes]|nr:hypothetical protein TNCV_1447191 [Trichonephila clavipes]